MGMKKIVFPLGALLIIQSVSAQRDTSANVLNPVIVTANKFEQKQNETGKVLTVISREELERSSARSLTEVLNEQAGIMVNGANNNLGTNQSISIDGATSANTLILIDGVPAYDPSGITSEFDLNYLNVNQIERVEILKARKAPCTAAMRWQV
jgi:vitamin B12 transporter